MKNFTNRDIYDILTERFNRIDIKLDKLGNRVRILEIWRGNIMGKIGILTGGITLIGTFVFSYIKEKLFQK